MPEKVKLAINWAGACGGCDVSLLDTEERLLGLLDHVEVVYWPVAMDFKRADVMAFGPGSIDVGLFNGAVRTSEQEEDARMMRERSKVLIAYGACASFGGIPGLANMSDREGIFDRVYRETPSTVNPDGVVPETEHTCESGSLNLPSFFDTVKSLEQVVDVDYFLPGCPPTPERIVDALDVVVGFARTGELPPKGTVIASAKALCDECDRGETRKGGRMEAIRRPHECLADPESCFLDQGLICLGPATRGGCGQRCIQVNMPCRGCFGPTEEMVDPGAGVLSAIGSIAGPAGEEDLQPHIMKRAINSVRDPLGTFYRFTFPSALVNRTVKEKGPNT